MKRQNASNKMFGLVMITVTLLLVACGGGDGDPTPTATTVADEAPPTLPADSTAAVLATEDISEDDITVVEPNIPATAESDEIASTPDLASASPTAQSLQETSSTGATPPANVGTPASQVTDLTGDAEPVSTPPSTADDPDTEMTGSPESTPLATAEIPAADTDETSTSTPSDDAVVEPDSTPETVANDVSVATAMASPEGGQFNVAGDGTGGSGQPGEPSSNLPGDAPSASPVAGISVEGCDVPNVPEFEGDTTAFATNAEVNFRSGPGTECDQILEDPLAPDKAVEVIGGPVTQTSDNTVWLQVEVDGVPGWVSEEFVEPVE